MARPRQQVPEAVQVVKDLVVVMAPTTEAFPAVAAVELVVSVSPFPIMQALLTAAQAVVVLLAH